MSEKQKANSASLLIRHTSASKIFKDKLKQIGDGTVVFDHVTSSAHPFICSLVAEHFLKHANHRVWIITESLQSQEAITEGIELWSQGKGAYFFPDLESVSSPDSLPDQERYAERMSVLKAINDNKKLANIIVVLEHSLNENVTTPESIDSSKICIDKGQLVGMDSLITNLEKINYEKESIVTERGQFAVRGGIIDIYPIQSPYPFRIEFFGDEIDSIREFDIDSQTSINVVDSCQVLSGTQGQGLCELKDYINNSDLVIKVGENDETSSVVITEGSSGLNKEEDFSTACFESPFGSFDAGEFILQQTRYKNFKDTLNKWHQEKWKAEIFFKNEGEIERFNELAQDMEALPKNGFPKTATGGISHGFTIPGSKLAVLASSEIFGRYESTKSRRLFNREKRDLNKRRSDDFRELNLGDRVVHMDQGIGIFRGLIEIETEGESSQEVLVIEYEDEAKLYVPLEQAHLVSRYIGSGNKAPPIDRLGGKRWISRKAKVEKSIMDYASQLIKTHAERNAFKSYKHYPDTKWQLEFENSFAYRETPDQISAISQTKNDMENDKPMDRLICGDVGFGKTEVAIRAIFKAVMSEKQVALLCPTTVLAQQHYETLKSRLSEYPIQVELLSRFKTPTEQKKTIKGISNGSTDIVVGTHRLVSKDVKFKNIGLAIIDEEQRFGVKHKERFKEMFHLIDVLTLSATPIPRTLYLSLMGVKDMSTIDTPPPGRSPVETTICQYDERIISRAIKRELKRGGQVFFLHNRVKTINRTKKLLQELVPKANIEIGHGQMDESILEDIMHRFIDKKIDILVCTTIIESGIDIPNANTIIIDRADRFGLADLYQLRGRVGRSGRKAFALLMLPNSLISTGDARKRINAIRQYTELGSGFKIAMRDLEIRGAGNLLGTQQSGHISAIGFELYCKLLKQSVERLNGNTDATRAECSLYLDFINTNEADHFQSKEKSLPAFIPSSYLEETKIRIAAYRQISELVTIKEMKGLIREWHDRFGKLPNEVRNLMLCTELKIRASSKGIHSVEIEGSKLMMKRNDEFILIEGKFPRINTNKNEERLKKAVDLLKKF
ncbi:transcription-repair coupling factor [Verrucomicrobia bacterium]|nr:transcription-repair coupling factor [Verrucomicrobiota bacterium]